MAKHSKAHKEDTKSKLDLSLTRGTLNLSLLDKSEGKKRTMFQIAEVNLDHPHNRRAQE